MLKLEKEENKFEINYELVSSLNIFSKTYKRILREYLTNYVDTFLSKFTKEFKVNT